MAIAIYISRLDKFNDDAASELFRGVNTKAAGKRFKGNGGMGWRGFFSQVMHNAAFLSIM
jgi:hypothetical protein